MTWTEADLRHEDRVIHYRDNGIDRPSIVACHGFSDSGECWMPILETDIAGGPLAERYRWLLLDAVGHGGSTDGDPYAAEQRAGTITTAIEALGVDRPGVLGHSMGAASAASFAELRPDLCGFLMLEDPPWRATADDADPRRSEFRLWLRQLSGLSIAELVAQCRNQNPRWPEAELEPWACSKLEFRFPNSESAGGAPPQPPRNIRCPVLLMTGNPSLGAMTPPATADELVRRWPRSEHVHFDSAGHNVRREAPAAFPAAVARFAATHIG